jgi:hypothetical protein
MANPTDLSEKRARLWIIATSPTIWAAHFLLSYGTAAIWCAKFAGAGGSLWFARAAILVYTVVALFGIAIIGWRGYVRHTFAGSTLPHDFDSPADRHRFLGFATLLLSGLSAVAVIYAALAAVFIGSCR